MRSLIRRWKVARSIDDEASAGPEEPDRAFGERLLSVERRLRGEAPRVYEPRADLRIETLRALRRARPSASSARPWLLRPAVGFAACAAVVLAAVVSRVWTGGPNVDPPGPQPEDLRLSGSPLIPLRGLFERSEELARVLVREPMGDEAELLLEDARRAAGMVLSKLPLRRNQG